jgi:hypothetical protein
LDAPVESAKSTVYYFAGEHTGMIVFIPLAAAGLALAAAELRASRNRLAVAFLVGIVGYILLYTVRFTDNYFGGGQSFGNRYFLQVSPMVIALVVASRVAPRRLLLAASACAVFGAIVLWPHHHAPERSFGDLVRTSPIQRLLPMESNQVTAGSFRCNYLDCEPLPDASEEPPSEADVGDAGPVEGAVTTTEADLVVGNG